MASSLRLIHRVRSLQRLRDQMAPRTLERISTEDRRFASFEEACKVYRIKTKGEGLVAFDPARWHDEQRRFNAERTGRDLVLKPRQVGFSTLELLRGLYQASTRQSWNVQVVIHDRELADGLFEIVHLGLESVTGEQRAPDLKRNRVRELVFSGLASSIRVTEAGATKRTAQKKGRSGTIHRLHATEVAFWHEPETSMAGLLGAVPDHGQVLIESTPNGAGGYFYDLVQAARRGDGEYKLHFFPWWQHQSYRAPVPEGFDARPRDRWEQKLRRYGCDDEQIAWWRTKVLALANIDLALQEFPCDSETCFRAAGRVYIQPEAVDLLAEETYDPRRREELVWKNGLRVGELRVFEEPRPGREYVVGADVAEGVDGDRSAVAVLDRKTGETVATMLDGLVAPGDFGIALAMIGRRYNRALVAPERNNHGHAALRALRSEAKYSEGRIYRHTDRKLGWRTDPATRPPLFDELRRAIETGVAWTPDADTVAECKTLIIDEDGRPRARRGCHDDAYVAWAIAWEVRSRPVTTARSTHVGGI